MHVQEDVTELGLTHAYWGMFYVSKPRHAVSRFTVPFLSDVGLAVIVKAKEETIVQQASTIFSPFSTSLWLLLIAVMFFVANLMFALEHALEHVETVPEQLTPEGHKSALKMFGAVLADTRENLE